MRHALTLVGSLVCFALVVGCQPAVEFDVAVEGEALIEAGGPLDQLVGAFPVFDNFASFDIESSQEFENNQTTKDHVQAAQVKLIRLSVIDPEGATFDFLNEISFFIASPKHAKVQVATKAVPNGATTVELDLSDVDVGPYVRDDTFSVTTTANGRNPSEDTTVRAELTLHVVAQP